MARLLWLADVLRRSGLKVVETPDWQNRGLNLMGSIAGVIAHATAGAAGGSTKGEVNVLMHGSVTAPPPIAQLYLARDGTFHVVASGLCNHAGRGHLWNVSGNSHVIGIEAGNNNRGEPWPAVQMVAYVQGVAAILSHLHLPSDRVGAHREWNPVGKSDPVGIEMNSFRAAVGRAMAGGVGIAMEEDWMANLGEQRIKPPADIKLPGVAKPIDREFSWWVGAMYGHILQTENKTDKLLAELGKTNKLLAEIVTNTAAARLDATRTAETIAQRVTELAEKS